MMMNIIYNKCALPNSRSSNRIGSLSIILIPETKDYRCQKHAIPNQIANTYKTYFTVKTKSMLQLIQRMPEVE